MTWSNWEAAGLDYDSAPAFADWIGFRAGTCHEFPPFHLFEYMKLAPDAALEAVAAVVREWRRYGGMLSPLWHNSSLPSARQKRWYEALVASVAGAAPTRAGT